MNVRTKQALLQAATAVAVVCAAAVIVLPAASLAAQVTTDSRAATSPSSVAHPVLEISSTRIR
jgi:hypothetical protein